MTGRTLLPAFLPYCQALPRRPDLLQDRITHHLNDIATIRHLIANPIRSSTLLRCVITSPFEVVTRAGRLQGLAETTHPGAATTNFEAMLIYGDNDACCQIDSTQVWWLEIIVWIVYSTSSRFVRFSSFVLACFIFVFNRSVKLELHALLYYINFLDSIYYDIERYGRYAGCMLCEVKFDEERL